MFVLLLLFLACKRRIGDCDYTHTNPHIDVSFFSCLSGVWLLLVLLQLPVLHSDNRHIDLSWPVFVLRLSRHLTSVPFLESAVLRTISPPTKNSFSPDVCLTLDVQLFCPRVSLAAK